MKPKTQNIILKIKTPIPMDVMGKILTVIGESNCNELRMVQEGEWILIIEE